MNYISITKQEKEAMLQKIGIKSIEELFQDIPKDLCLKDTMAMPKGLSEHETKKLLIKLLELFFTGNLKQVMMGEEDSEYA